MEKIKINGKKYNVHISDTDDKRMKGLLGKKSLKNNEGMLFIYDDPCDVSYTMEGMEFPIDIVFIDEDSEVIKVENAEIGESNISCEGALYVLEVNQYSGISVGDIAEIDEDITENESDKPDENSGEKRMVLYDDKGDEQSEITPGDRVFSRKSVDIIIKKAKKARETNNKSDFRALARYVMQEVERQNNREEEYVENKRDKKAEGGPVRSKDRAEFEGIMYYADVPTKNYEQYYNKYFDSVPKDVLLRQLFQESRFKPSAESEAGAKGIAQFMPATWDHVMKLGFIPKGSDINDTKLQRIAQEKYMNWLLERPGVDGNLRKALAAYNTGIGRVQGLSKKYGEDWEDYLPKEETKRYINEIMGKRRDINESIPPPIDNNLEGTNDYSDADKLKENVGDLKEVVDENKPLYNIFEDDPKRDIERKRQSVLNNNLRFLLNENKIQN